MAVAIKTNDPSIKVFYNISQHVGPGKINLHDDVQLVQVLITDLVKGGHVPLGVLNVMPPPSISGSFDHATAYWILVIQHLARADVKPDGVVSPLKGKSIYYSESKMYTIGGLNYLYATKMKQKFYDLPKDTRLGPGLKAAIKWA